jgi:hypothetical protein
MPRMRTVAESDDLGYCPFCGSVARRYPAGVARNSGQPYSEFWGCDGPVPCTEVRGDEERVLSWKSTKQWAFLHDRGPVA